MRKLFFPLILMSVLFTSCGQTGSEQASDDALKSVEHNKKIATLYHDLDPANVDVIFTEDFAGHGENHDWDRESHRNYLGNDSYKKDSILQQIAEGDWVATWFIRTGDFRGGRISVPIMHFKHFRDGKIFELWEYYNFQEDEDEDNESGEAEEADND